MASNDLVVVDACSLELYPFSASECHLLQPPNFSLVKHKLPSYFLFEYMFVYQAKYDRRC